MLPPLLSQAGAGGAAAVVAPATAAAADTVADAPATDAVADAATVAPTAAVHADVSAVSSTGAPTDLEPRPADDLGVEEPKVFMGRACKTATCAAAGETGTSCRGGSSVGRGVDRAIAVSVALPEEEERLTQLEAGQRDLDHGDAGLTQQEEAQTRLEEAFRLQQAATRESTEGCRRREEAAAAEIEKQR